MPVTFTDMCVDDLVPMRAVYQRTKVTPEDVAKARAEALQAETEKLVKVKGVIGKDEPGLIRGKETCRHGNTSHCEAASDRGDRARYQDPKALGGHERTFRSKTDENLQ